MSRKIILVGLAALCALAFSAVASSAAQAAGTTAYTCVSGAGEGPQTFGNADCSTAGTGFGHASIANGTHTELTLKQFGEAAQLVGEPFGAELALVANNGFSCIGCSAENTEAGGVMKVVGPASGTAAGHLKYEGVTAPGTGCTVESAPGGEVGVVTTEPLKFETDATNHVLISPVNAEEVLTGFTLASCELEGNYTVNGDVTAEANGAILTPLNVEGTLTLNGFFPAHLSGEATIEAGVSGVHHPAALT